MAGQDATLTVAQAKAQQERICAHEGHQGSSKKTKEGHTKGSSSKEKY